MNPFFEISRYMLRVLFFFLSDEVNPATSRVEGNLRLTWSRCALVQYTDDDDRQAAAKRPSEISTLNGIGSLQIVALVSDGL